MAIECMWVRETWAARHTASPDEFPGNGEQSQRAAEGKEEAVVASLLEHRPPDQPSFLVSF